LLRMWGRKDQTAGSFNEHSCTVIFSFRHVLQLLTLFLALSYGGCNVLIIKWAFEKGQYDCEHELCCALDHVFVYCRCVISADFRQR